MNQLKRELGIFDATLLGLGSIVGTGIFVSVAIAASIAGQWVLLAIFLASLVAVCNGLSSAQLAAAHPVSGGTYEYANRWINPTVGFIAGWMFLVAKSASAATAAIGFSHYVWPWIFSSPPSYAVSLLVSYAALALLTYFAMTGIKRSAYLNAILVSITMGSLVLFIVVGIVEWFSQSQSVDADAVGTLTSSTAGSTGLWEATALMFVAYTGYGRIATLGEEVINPRQTIPRAIITTLLCSMALYFGVALVAIGTAGAGVLANAADSGGAALQVVAQTFNLWPESVSVIIAIGATVSLLGVLFNLLLGLSRVALAMGRRRDLPAVFSNIDPTTAVPGPATILISVIIAVLISLGSIKTAWSLSAFTVLIYYGITNACAIRMEPELRLYSVWPAWLGLAACFALAFCVPPRIWLVGCGLIVVGLAFRQIRLRTR